MSDITTKDTATPRIEPFRLVAFIDMDEVGLYVERDGEFVEDLGWPADWPEKVSIEFIKQHGFEIEQS